MEAIITFFASLMASIGAYFSPAKPTVDFIPVKQEIIIADERIAYPSTSVTPSITKKVLISATVTPTPSDDVKTQCKNASKPEKYFAGFGCYYDEYQNALKENQKTDNLLIKSVHAQEGSIDSRINTNKLTIEAKAGLGDLFYTICLKVTPKVYQSCTDSLERNSGRLSAQIYTVFASEISQCTAKVSAGDEKMKGDIKDSFWRWKMRKNIDRLYDHCAKNNGTLDSFNF